MLGWGACVRILILGLNYSPELVGIGPYTSEMAVSLVQQGHAVQVVAARPYYPGWTVPAEFRGRGYRRGLEAGVNVVRCPLYVPANPTGARRILHHLSFAATSLWPIARALFGRDKPDLMIAIAPSLMSVPGARILARLRGVRTWLHIQDFEVGAALATGLIGEHGVAGRLARLFEKAAHAGFDRYSSISPQMCRRLVAAGIPADRVVELRNWSDITAVTPLQRPSDYRAAWNITTPHVALYSGNIANKQGVEIVLDAARRLSHRRDLTFVICGDGARKEALAESAADLANIRFHPLQPRARLSELLGLATIHLLPQLEGAADLVLPSKLTNMLASGRPVVATAAPGTGLAEEVQGCGLISTPGDPDRFARAIETLMDDAPFYAGAAREARLRAERSWSKDTILRRLDRWVREMAPGR
ncbi:MAG: colanic acid biosynthesis glycosyltransferase WcaI [Sphingomonas bacterium]|nr:colanic acid biosynthesis glycosyltransferase WcaI [Sphingomonas bacterium]